MADIALTAARIAAVFGFATERFDMIAAVALTPGQVVYRDSNGKAALADANAGGGAEMAAGIALNACGAGGAVSVLKSGHIAGFTVSGLAYGARVYLSDTAGALADASSTTNLIPVGSVVSLSDADLTKVLYVDFSPPWVGAGFVGQSKVFVSTEQTGTGASQNIAHGLGAVPRMIIVTPTDLTPATVGSYSVVEGAHTSTNVVVTVTSGKKFKVLAFA